MTTIDERVAALEEAYKHLATKADLARLETSLRGEMGALETSLRGEMGALETSLRGEMGALETSLRGELGALETSLSADIAALHATVQTAGWAIGIGVAIIALPQVWRFLKGAAPQQRADTAVDDAAGRS